MIQITPQMRILLSIEPADFRCGIDGLVSLCKSRLHSDPFCGAMFVFRNKRATSLKCLVYDGQGFWLCHKRLSCGRFQWWPKDGSERSKELAAHELQLLVWNGDPGKAGAQADWRPVRVVR